MIQIPTAKRLLIDVPVEPAQGSRFQPTGFPDLGAATFERPTADGLATTSNLIVESRQSVANHLEKVCVDADNHLVSCLSGLPYVSVKRDGVELTNSLLEAHRLNSVYIEKEDGGKFHKQLTEAIGYDAKKPHDFRKLAGALFLYDPNSLIHGTFLESIAGVLRVPRLVSGFVEAEGIERVPFGGVKNDRVTAAKDGDKDAKAGYGNVPFHREDFTARTITAYFNIDLQQLRSYALGSAGENLLFALSLWKIQAFLDEGLRLRTACDLVVSGTPRVRPGDYALPGRAVLEEQLPGLIDACHAKFASPPITVVAA